MFFLSKAKVCNEFLTVETIEHGGRRVVVVTVSYESHKTTGSAAICGFMQELNGNFPGVKLLSVRRHVVIGRGERAVC